MYNNFFLNVSNYHGLLLPESLMVWMLCLVDVCAQPLLSFILWGRQNFHDVCMRVLRVLKIGLILAFAVAITR